jgi:hypothetical protein
MAKRQSRYISYLLRIWLADVEGGPAGRASLESPITGERKVFANLDELCRFLRQSTNSESREEFDEIGRC